MHRVSRTLSLPAVGRLINEPDYARLAELFSHDLVVAAVREQVDGERSKRSELAAGERLALVEQRLREWTEPSLKRVINATGVVLHTNLGRAPLGLRAAQAVADVAAGYSNLELDLQSGRRGERASHVVALWKRLTGAPAALTVNNNAGAILLALTALCRGREVIVSRGQQVEIGGSFRMPDVMRLSGARMVEVGTTNRTRAADYEAAITPKTGAILRVHPSNFVISGFTEMPGLEELAQVTSRHGVLLIDDLGSGSIDGAHGEPSVGDSLKHATVTTFSGDKLLGGPQAGVLLGSEEAIRKCAKHPLARALRVDKLTLAALQGTLRDRLLGVAGNLPVEKMLAISTSELRRRAAWMTIKLGDREIESTLLEADSTAGGGSLPGHSFPTVLVAITGPASRLAAALRRGDPPVLARIEADLCCLDPRTILRGEDETLFDAVERAVASLGR